MTYRNLLVVLFVVSLVMVAVTATAGGVDITRKGRWEVLDQGGGVVSQHDEIHVAFEAAANLSQESGAEVFINPPIYSVSTVPCPTVPPVEPCPDCPVVVPCPDCPACPEDPEPPPIEPPDPEPKLITLEWEHPTSRENGDTLDLGELDHYEARIRTGASEWVLISLLAVNPNGTEPPSYTFPAAFSPGAWDIGLRVYDTDLLVSDWSETVSVTVTDEGICPASVPDVTSVTATTDGYQVTWTPHCGDIIAEQCKGANINAGENCWSGGAVYGTDGVPGAALVPLNALDVTRVNDAGECGLRFRATNGSATSSATTEYWTGTACSE